jgi:AAA15 family ATPase/GTPase
MFEQHLTYFKIKNFKRFESLEVKNIGQINLIVGDNNIGKTSFLEALILNSKVKENLGVFHTILKSKNPMYETVKMTKVNPIANYRDNIFARFLNKLDVPLELKLEKKNSSYNLEYKVENKNEKLSQQENEELKQFAKIVIETYREIDTLSENWLFTYVDNKPIYIIDITSKFYANFANTYWTLPLISLKDSFDSELFVDYLKFDPKKEEYVLRLLNEIFTNIKIQKIRAISNTIQIATSERYAYHSITEYGDGLLRALKFIIKLISTDNPRIMIDEVEAGVHFSKQKDLWKILFQLSNETEKQLFCTTHSQECIEAFFNAAKESGFDEKIRLIELERGNEKTYASTYTFDQIKSGLISNVNLRG